MITFISNKFEKTCIKLGIKECSTCLCGANICCWVDYYKYQIIQRRNFNMDKKYIINTIKRMYDGHMCYFKGAAYSIDPKYISFIDKILILC